MIATREPSACAAADGDEGDVLLAPVRWTFERDVEDETPEAAALRIARCFGLDLAEMTRVAARSPPGGGIWRPSGRREGRL